MNTATRLAAYGAGLVLCFGGAWGVAGAVTPDRGDAPAATPTGGHGDSGQHETGQHGGSGPEQGATHGPKGVSLAADGFALSEVEAPHATGAPGTLSFHISDAEGAPVTEFATAHDKELHLIVVRGDGSQFRHVHPVLDRNTGTWSLPWTWTEAGSYRVYADFTPDAAGATGVTLTRTVEVAGNLTPVEKQPTRTDEVDGFTVSLDGDLLPGESSGLSISVRRGDEPVTTLQPYLGAFGHLVALRDGDLAYLHVHAEGAEPRPGQESGPRIDFAAEAPTAGKYLLYLDFQVDGQVHTAEFVLDAGDHQHTGTGTSHGD